MPKVSIIVPVYKVEQYIRECLDSIKQQTFSDWECLLIDDGSPDNSGMICNEYAHADARFRVFHVDNGGVSRARNIGLDNMLGEWVLFVDSDDIIAVNTLETCLDKVEKYNLDILQFSFTRNKECLGGNDGTQTDVLSLSEYAKSKKIQVCAAGSLLRTSIIQDNDLRFDISLKLAEDQLFIYEYMDLSKRFMRIGDQLYYYRDSPNSATRHQKPEDVRNSIDRLAGYKCKSPLWQGDIDHMLVSFLICLILNPSVSAKDVKELTSKANLTDTSHLTGSYRLFYHVSKINVILAIYLIKIKFKVFGNY